MGWCHEFGPQIRPGCGHPMQAGDDACYCSACGVRCTGQFAACPDVWAAGPIDLDQDVRGPRLPERPTVELVAASNGAAPSVAEPEAVAALEAVFERSRSDLQALSASMMHQQVALTDLAETLPAKVVGVVSGTADQRPERVLTRRTRELLAEVHAALEMFHDSLSQFNERSDRLEETETKLMDDAIDRLKAIETRFLRDGLDRLEAIDRKVDRVAHRLVELDRRLADREISSKRRLSRFSR